MQDLAIEQQKFKELSRKDLAEKFQSLENRINYAKDVNFYIIIFLMVTIVGFIVFLFIISPKS